MKKHYFAKPLALFYVYVFIFFGNNVIIDITH